MQTTALLPSLDFWRKLPLPETELPPSQISPSLVSDGRRNLSIPMDLPSLPTRASPSLSLPDCPSPRLCSLLCRTTLSAMKHILEGHGKLSFALVLPPGQHAWLSMRFSSTIIVFIDGQVLAMKVKNQYSWKEFGGIPNALEELKPVSLSTKAKPTKLQKRKHQIGSLYFDMKQEMELAERRARGFLTKAETQAKYGWMGPPK